VSDDVYRIHPVYDYWQTGQSGARGSFNENWWEFYESDVTMGGLALCVELVFGKDKVVRIGTKSVSVTDNAGKVYRFQALMTDQPELSNTYSIGEPASQARSFTVQLPSSLVDPISLVSQGKMIAGIGEVSLQYDGGTYEDRLVVMRGEMDTGITFGPLAGGIIECTITDPKEGVDITLPPNVIDTERFPDVPSEAIGQRFPVVIPRFKWTPAQFISGAGTGVNPYALVCQGDATVYSVYVDGELKGSGDAVYGWTKHDMIDGKGVSYTAIRFDVATTAFDFTEGVYVDVAGPDQEKNPLQQIKKILSSYSGMNQSGINEWLFSKAEAKIPYLDSRMCINAGGSSNTKALTFIEGEFLQSFPMISMVWSQGGYGPVVTDRTQIDKIVAYLTVGQAPLLSRATIVQETPKTELRNEFTIRYNYNAQDDVYESVAIRTSETSTLCQISQQLVGYRPDEVIDSTWITDDATANYVLDWLVEHISVPSYYVEYDATPITFFNLSIGDNVRLTDSDFNWSEKVATVQTLTLGKGYCKIGLRVWVFLETVSGAARSYNTSNEQV
jgi:hypothetical protein